MNNSGIFSRENKTIFIVGPTSSGKTEIAHKLAKKISGAEIISADSMQIYKNMDILTAKPTIEQRREIPYHLIDSMDLDNTYSAFDFHDDALRLVTEILYNGKIPIIVGGTGLYVRSLLRGIFQAPEANWEFRKDMENFVMEYGEIALHNLLKIKDPEAAGKIDPRNIRRVIRALEVFQFTGKKISELQQHWNKPYHEKHPVMGYLFLWGIFWPRRIMYERVNSRVDEMVQQGLVEEVKNLIGLGVMENTVASQAIGIKEISQYLENKISLDAAIELIKQNTRKFSRRQLTWFSREEEFKWFVLYKNADKNKIIDVMIEELKKN